MDQTKFWKKDYMNNIKSQSIEGFIKNLGSSSPTPGGGAAAALSGAMAASLVEMVANLTIGKKKYEGVQKQAQIISKDASKFSKELLSLADEDTKAFDQVIASYRSKNKAQIKKALLLAIEIPSRISSFSKQTERLGQKIAKIGSKNAISDARSAIYLARAAYKAAQENIKINKKTLAALK